ncbi:Uncharacterised protein [uncultured archaeon]|nr:Uncharacterised protein [uncultured archaeon]
MKHPDRAFSFKEIHYEDELVDAMFNHKWPLCYSFYHNRLLFLSDGESEDFPEYAVVTIDKTEGRFGVQGREVGRIQPTGMQQKDGPEILQRMFEGNYTGSTLVRVVAEPKWHHRCELCGLEGE